MAEQILTQLNPDGTPDGISHYGVVTGIRKFIRETGNEDAVYTFEMSWTRGFGIPSNINHGIENLNNLGYNARWDDDSWSIVVEGPFPEGSFPAADGQDYWTLRANEGKR